MSEKEDRESTRDRTEETSTVDVPKGDNGEEHRTSTSTLQMKRQQKESLILQELSTTLHTIQNVSHVLDDIVRLTAAPTADDRTTNAGTNDTTNNVAVKQQRLLEELHQWKQLLLPSGGSQKNDTKTE